MAQQPANKSIAIKISFVNTCKSTPLVLDSVQYTNTFGETYSISKLKYYIGNVTLRSVTHTGYNGASIHSLITDGYQLIDAQDTTSLYFNCLADIDRYDSISFLIGVDSIKNVSGAQTDALDPAKGMFWTWNSGYIFFKLEGSSPVSKLVNHKIEYHIGGFSGMNNALRTVTLPLNGLSIKKDSHTEIMIEADLDKFWSKRNQLKIVETAATMTPGVLSTIIADNYSRMFSIKAIINH